MSDTPGLGTFLGGLYIGSITNQLDKCRALYEETGLREYRIAYNSFRSRLKRVVPKEQLPERLRRMNPIAETQTDDL